MKFFAAAVSALFTATTVVAQSVLIASPAANTTVTAGAPLTVRIQRPAFQSSSVEVAVAIAVRDCGSALCGGDYIGTILYNGPYSPTEHATGSAAYYQDFTVTVPSTALKGTGQLNVVHFAFVGAALEPWVQPTLTEAITIV